MKITHDPDKHKFNAHSDSGDHMGEIEYSPRGDHISAIHTWTADAYRGQGVAQELLDAMAEYAVANSLTITPVCSYVAAAFKRHPERYQQVIRKRLKKE